MGGTQPSSTDAWSLQVARRHRAALLHEIHLFEHAIASPSADPGWRQRVGTRLRTLRGAFAEHIVVTEGEDGLYAELLAHAPRLHRRVQMLTREHAAIAVSMSAMQRRADLPGSRVDELRRCGGEVLRALSRHRQRGADLVYDAYETDIGGET
ncbi:hypothetical protein Ais01nite_41920 [Asanoa ishikariensis]|uniref:Hemerythrin HHE cation binding domain-containing protein n=1 Tax=Asanoa ishikariensis TaxID=137265 RepID=A0A1H3MJL9_9ACTN|nr:hypothetical protein [Asanoa ishikariensis]GIF66157.1 hypothetical protein Ais01nite_41920 [Asanoa ishikariensis]SDY76504.1 hypothetical protein SAMN05421684_1432 [Asanoa ishikariensis]